MPKITAKRVGLAIAVTAVLLIFYSIRSCGSDVQYEYSYEKVSVGKVEKTVAATGLLDVNEKKAVLCKINGLISTVRVDPEDSIKKGQVLATLDSSEIDQKLLRLNTRLESSRLAVVSAERRYNGKKEMLKENLVSQKDLEQSEIDYKTALNDYILIRLEQSETRQQKTSTVIVSPIDGVIVQSSIGTAARYDSVGVGVNMAVFYVAPTLKTMELTLDIDESDIGSVRKNQNVVFTVSAFPDKKFSGEITYVSISPVHKGGLVVYQPTVICNNAEMLLKPGMTATATIVTDTKENVLRVANQALIVSPELEDDAQRGDAPVVWKKSGNPLSNDPVNMVEVTIGLSGDMFTEITGSGLKEGDDVLVKIRQVDK
jgi:HlyD family secretion protein